jgi:hypothetical protein
MDRQCTGCSKVVSTGSCASLLYLALHVEWGICGWLGSFVSNATLFAYLHPACLQVKSGMNRTSMLNHLRGCEKAREILEAHPVGVAWLQNHSIKNGIPRAAKRAKGAARTMAGWLKPGDRECCQSTIPSLL